MKPVNEKGATLSLYLLEQEEHMKSIIERLEERVINLKKNLQKKMEKEVANKTAGGF